MLLPSLIVLGEVIKQNSAFPTLLCSIIFGANKGWPMRGWGPISEAGEGLPIMFPFCLLDEATVVMGASEALS